MSTSGTTAPERTEYVALWKLFGEGESVRPLNREAMGKARARIDSQTKPLGSLGRLEEIAERLSGMAYPMDVAPARLFTVAADHGVSEEGVSLFPREVTRQMVANFFAGGAAVNALTEVAGMQLRIVDAGCAGGPFEGDIVDMRLGDGTANMAHGPAMSVETCVRGIRNGISLAKQAVAEGCRCLAIGEMGIANSTSATALYARLLELSAGSVVGPGTGLDTEAMRHKTDVVRRALQVNAKEIGEGNPPDPVRTLACLGGFEICTMTGIVLGGALCGVPVLVDGFIATSAYVAAVLIEPLAADYCFLAHASTEPGHAQGLRKLASHVSSPDRVEPLLHLGMHLGEGTGCAVAYPLLLAAVNVYRKMATFDEARVSTAG